MSDVAPSIWAALPRELVLSILEYACTGSQSTCLSISVVSSWTRPISDQFLYESVVVNNDERLFNLQSSTKLHYVKALHLLYLNDVASEDGGNVIRDILRKLSHLQHLSISSYELFRRVDLEGLCRVPDCHWLTIFAIPDPDEDQQFITDLGVGVMIENHFSFLGITHLEFKWTCSALLDNNVRAKAMEVFPNVSHIAWTFEVGCSEAFELRKALGNPPIAPERGQIFIVHIYVSDDSDGDLAEVRKRWEDSMAIFRWPETSCILIADEYRCSTKLEDEDIWAQARCLMEGHAL